MVPGGGFTGKGVCDFTGRGFSETQKPGDNPNFKDNALGVQRPVSDFLESSWLFSEKLPKFKS